MYKEDMCDEFESVKILVIVHGFNSLDILCYRFYINFHIDAKKDS